MIGSWHSRQGGPPKGGLACIPGRKRQEGQKICLTECCAESGRAPTTASPSQQGSRLKAQAWPASVAMPNNPRGGEGLGSRTRGWGGSKPSGKAPYTLTGPAWDPPKGKVGCGARSAEQPKVGPGRFGQQPQGPAGPRDRPKPSRWQEGKGRMISAPTPQ